MIGLDTNILVRYLTQDDPHQPAIARHIFEHRLTARNPGYISLVVMVETAWVLAGAYRQPAAELAATLERLLQIETLKVQEEQAVFTALSLVRNGRGDFADALIGALNDEAGCRHTLTFDRKAARLPSFELART
jgi:predicted nucleic-acid-binding protein